MPSKKSFRDLSDLPTQCPVCDLKRKDAAAVAIHNNIAASTGCRAYPQPTYRKAYAT